MEFEDEVEFSECQPGSKSKGKEADGAEMETNKYNRNVLLVMDCVMNGMKHLFTDDDRKVLD